MSRKEEGKYRLGLLKIVIDINVSLPPQLFDRRAKMVHETEWDFWRYLSKECTSTMKTEPIPGTHLSGVQTVSGYLSL
jgi:hypothetical protein